MRMRFGLLVGFAIGYVLGAKAGRERYEQIMEMWGSVSRSEPAQQLGEDVRVAASRMSESIERKASEGADKVTSMVRGGGSDVSNGSIAT